jgi:hypothetical protein
MRKAHTLRERDDTFRLAGFSSCWQRLRHHHDEQMGFFSAPVPPRPVASNLLAGGPISVRPDFLAIGPVINVTPDMNVRRAFAAPDSSASSVRICAAALADSSPDLTLLASSSNPSRSNGMAGLSSGIG